MKVNLIIAADKIQGNSFSSKSYYTYTWSQDNLKRSFT